MASPAAILQVFVNANTKAATGQLAMFDRQLKGTAASANATSAAMGGKMARGAKIGAAGFAALGAAAVVAGKQLYDLGVQFDEAYDRIRVGTGATGRELDKLKGNFRSVAKTVPNDFRDVGTAIADLNTRLGLTGKPLERMAEQILHLSNITGENLESNIKSVARSFVDWEVPVSKQTSALDGLFRLSQKSGSTVSEIADNIQKFGSPLRTLGKDIEYGAALFANFERAGVNMQTTLPGLKQFIGNLAKPTENLSAQLKQLGINANNPAAAFERTLEVLGPNSKLTEGMKKNFAVAIFGKRAYADMLEAIKQGRFELDEFIDVFNDGRGDSIRKAADETYDFSENAKILGNNLKIYLEPVANAVFIAVDQAVRALNQGVRELDGTSKKSTTLGTILKVLSQIVYGVIKVFQVFFRTTKRVIEGIIQVVRGFVQMFRGSFNIVTGLLTGRWRKAWNGAKTFAGGAIKSIVGAIKSITAPARSVFQGIAEVVRDKFASAYRTAANFVNKILGIIDSIPGINVGRVSTSTKGNPFGEGSSRPGRAAGLQRGGVLMGGKPSGDSIPAMLERGEYVLNREAVKKIGVQRLNDLNFKQAARFQEGGYIDTLRSFPGKIVKPIKNAASSALDLLMDGPGQFLKMLPKPKLPQPITGLGPWLIDQVTSFIKKNAQSPLKDNSWVDSNTFTVARFLANRFSASISSSYRSPERNKAAGGVPNSSHTRGTPSNPGAFDFVPPSGAMKSFAGKNIAGIVENMIHDVGSGLHNHIAFFQGGGLVGMQKGGEIGKRKRKRKQRRKAAKLARAGLRVPFASTLDKNSSAINRQNELIQVAERLATAEFGPAGSEETEAEIAQQIALYEKLYELQQARAELLAKAMGLVKKLVGSYQTALKNKPPKWKRPGFQKGIRNGKSTINSLRNQLVDLLGITGFNNGKIKPFRQIFSGELGETNFRLSELGVKTAGSASQDSDLANLLREQLTQAQRTVAITQAQTPIFQQFMPKFHQGGIVQGPMGAERPVMAQAGEGIFTREQMRAMGSQNITVVIEDAAIDSNRIRVEVDGVLQDKVSTVRRQGSNRRFATR